MDSAAQALRARRAVRSAARDDPLERAHARTQCSATSPRRCRAAAPRSERLIGMCRRYGLPDIEQLSDEIIRRSEEATRAAIRKLKAGTFVGESKFDVPGGEIITLEGGGDDRSGRRRDHDRLRRQLAADLDRHQRGAQLHPCLFDLRGAQLPQSRPAQQHRQPGADQGEGAGRLDRQLHLSVAGECPPRRRHVCADADPQGALQRDAGARARRRLRRGLDDADPGPARRTASRSPPRCSTIPAAWARARPSRGRAPPATRPAWRRCRSRSSKR